MRTSPTINLMTRTVRKAGQIALRHFDRPDRMEVREKSPNDFVTTADLEVEREIIYHLKKAHPDYGVNAEETGGNQSGEHRWIIDPIDGTTNFLRGIPHFALSVALAKGDQVISGVVYDPVKDELFSAERGQGAFLNNRRIRVNRVSSLKSSLLCTGFPVKDKQGLEAYLELFNKVFLAAAGVRRAGSAALDLAYTAAGRLDGFWESRLSPWDVAAGSLLVQEAGGMVTDFDAREGWLASGTVLAASPVIHKELLRIMKETGVVQAEKAYLEKIRREREAEKKG